jgi:hypothetical protein
LDYDEICQRADSQSEICFKFQIKVNSSDKNLSRSMLDPIGPIALTLCILLACIAFMLLSAWVFYPSWERAFRSDASPVSWLSSALLITLSVLSLRLFADGSLSPRWALWLACSFSALALDEQFMLHEQWKYRCELWWSACRYETVREAPILLIGLVGGLTVLGLHRKLSNRMSQCLIWAALTVGLVAIFIDQHPTTEAIAVLEEAFEVMAEALFLAALMGLSPRNNA